MKRFWWVAVVAAAAAFALGAAQGPAQVTPARVATFPIAGSHAIRAGDAGVLPRRSRGRLGPITVTGSRTGAHAGELRPHSDGRGASFVPEKRFARGREGDRADAAEPGRRARRRGLVHGGAAPLAERRHRRAAEAAPAPARGDRPLPLAARSRGPGGAHHPPRRADGARLHHARAVLAQGQPAARRPADQRRPRRPRVVQAGTARHRGHRPQGAAPRRQARAHLVGGALRGRLGLRRLQGARHALPAGGLDRAEERLPRRPPRHAAHRPRHRARAGLRPREARPAPARGRQARLRARQRRPGDRSRHRPRRLRMALARPGAARGEPHAPAGAALVGLLPHQRRRGGRRRQPDRLRAQHLHALQAGPRRRVDHLAARRQAQRLPDGPRHALLLPARPAPVAPGRADAVRQRGRAARAAQAVARDPGCGSTSAASG